MKALMKIVFLQHSIVIYRVIEEEPHFSLSQEAT